MSLLTWTLNINVTLKVLAACIRHDSRVDSCLQNAVDSLCLHESHERPALRLGLRSLIDSREPRRAQRRRPHHRPRRVRFPHRGSENQVPPSHLRVAPVVHARETRAGRAPSASRPDRRTHRRRHRRTHMRRHSGAAGPGTGASGTGVGTARRHVHTHTCTCGIVVVVKQVV